MRRPPRGLLLAAPLLGGCGGYQSALDPAGVGAARIGHLGSIFLGLAVVVELAVGIFALYAVSRRLRRRDADLAPTEKDPRVERRMTHVVAVAGVATAVVLLGLLGASVATGREIAALGSREDLHLQVVGHQWWWEINYLDPTPSNHATTANEIHIPVGRRVRIDLDSHDVIHSFWVPNLHGKRDLIPGKPTSIWIQADRPGVYRGQCAEFCGHQHAHMAFFVIAEEQAQFDTWLAHQRAPAAPPANDLEKRGLAVFLQGPCVMCHAIDGTDAGASAGPNLTHVASRGTLAAGALPNTTGHLAGWITDPQSVKPGNHMPPILLPSEDLQALLAYLGSLK